MVQYVSFYQGKNNALLSYLDSGTKNKAPILLVYSSRTVSCSIFS